MDIDNEFKGLTIAKKSTNLPISASIYKELYKIVSGNYTRQVRGMLAYALFDWAYRRKQGLEVKDNEALYEQFGSFLLDSKSLDEFVDKCIAALQNSFHHSHDK